MNIFYASAEVEPFAKSGGLGDVLGALPKAVAKQGHDVSVVMPYYKSIIAEQYQRQMSYLGYFFTDVGWRHQYCGVFSAKIDGVNYYFIDNEFYFVGPLYNFNDMERFAYFAKAFLDMLGWLNVKPDVVHCNDWSTALIPVLHDAFYRGAELYKDIKFVYTIHNLRYQGKAGKEQVQDLTGLPDSFFTYDRLMHGDCVNLMKGAIVFSQAVTTVSPTYAWEITTDAYSEYLGDVTRAYAYKTTGILNGVDYSLYNPATDKLITKNYDTSSAICGKAENKAALQRELGLPQRDDVAMIAIISRLVDQKGLDIVGEALEEILQHDVQLVVLGTGEQRYEDMFRNAASRHPHKMSANIRFNNAFAHRLYAASDFVLVPSLFEPCGLTQLIGLKYGAIPIVRETGGLKDTVHSYNEFTDQGNGFSFANYNAHDMSYTIGRALNFYYTKRQILEKIRLDGMNCDYSWAESSKNYIDLYAYVVGIDLAEKLQQSAMRTEEIIDTLATEDGRLDLSQWDDQQLAQASAQMEEVFDEMRDMLNQYEEATSGKAEAKTAKRTQKSNTSAEKGAKAKPAAKKTSAGKGAKSVAAGKNAKAETASEKAKTAKRKKTDK